ncbi:MAG: PqqD family protein [Candidatus Electrothrix sp. AR4]|nr:PqqD family protein [Candidatus Electrothrix sp. AR4]
MRVELTGVFSRAENIVTRKVMDETLLVPISGDLASMDELYTLNDTGAYLWETLDGIRTLAEIGQKLKQRYAASPAVIEADMLEIMNGLADVGLIVAEN